MAIVPTQKNPERFGQSHYRPEEERDVDTEGKLLSQLTSAAWRTGRWWVGRQRAIGTDTQVVRHSVHGMVAPLLPH